MATPSAHLLLISLSPKTHERNESMTDKPKSKTKIQIQKKKKMWPKGMFYNLEDEVLPFFYFFSFPLPETNVLCDFFLPVWIHLSRKLNNFIGITKLLVILTALDVLLLPPSKRKKRCEFLRVQPPEAPFV